MVRFSPFRRFSLASLLGAVSLICVTLGWTVGAQQAVSQRKDLLMRCRWRNAIVAPAVVQSTWTPRSWLRWKLGDIQIDSLVLPDNEFPEERTQLAHAFPEADVHVGRNNPLINSNTSPVVVSLPPPAPPATRDHAVRLLDLTRFPLAPDLVYLRERSCRCLAYEVQGNVKDVFALERRELTDRG